MMNKNCRQMNDNFDDEFEDDYGDDNYYSKTYISYPMKNRYNNAYGNYRGGYDRSNQGPPLGFGPIGPMGPWGAPGPMGHQGPPGPPYPMQGDTRWRRGYNNDGPPDNIFGGPRKDRIVKYLLKCGIPREHVIHLPNDLLAMMHPMNCGLCAVKFESTDLSRIHYASKNHLKSQKKWVNQQADPYTLHSKEPLRARELYCELCDVQITSTGHAESHYAGKPHRAIVEGRKNPRNPFLLQPNKQGRLNILIRREMKCLKKSDNGPANKKKKLDNKPNSSELYCEICKTSMMCSEQMTTHLNGKRHLSKEKQHILRLMKGETADNGDKNGSKDKTREVADQGDNFEADEDDEESGEDDEGEDEGDKARDGDGARGGAEAVDDDWGEGGEDWKPSSEDY